MTGYGRGEASNADVTVVVELKSVNNRFRDVQLRCPREYLELESKITNVLKDAVHRGRVDVAIRRTTTNPAARVVAHEGLAREYARVIRELADRMGHGQTPLEWTFILQQPGVLTINEVEVDGSAEWSVVENALRTAIAELVAMRRAEGDALGEEIAGLVEEVRGLVAEIGRLADGVQDRIRTRLQSRLQRLVTEGVDPQRLAQEVAVLADKADVTEELFRLRSHCDRLADCLSTTQSTEESAAPIGRRLDFLLQEMNREVNTIGSKTTEHPVSDRVVELKSTLERIREQSANVE